MSQNKELTCFVIMPFRTELHYFYLFMKQHIIDVHGIRCFRGDEKILTDSMLNKVRTDIESADVIIADCSGRNPNVFYELGMAHTLNKKVILITGDDVEKAPADIRHYEFIHYELAKDKEFLSALDNALQNVFIERYDDLYQQALSIYDEFKQGRDINVKKVEKQVFVERVIQAKKQEAMPDPQQTPKFREFLLYRIISENASRDINSAIENFFCFPQAPLILKSMGPNS